MENGNGGDDDHIDEHDDGLGDEPRVDSGGRATTTIPRPGQRRASDAGRSRLTDLRRRRDRHDRADRIAPRRRSAWLFGLAALVVAGAIAAALFGLPVRTWFAQDDELQRLQHELDELSAVNSDLEDEVARLQTDDGVREAIRDELGHIDNGESRESLQALPLLPRDLPDGWPYSQVERVITLRTAERLAEVAATSSTTVAPTAAAPVTVATSTTLAAAPTTAAPAPAAPTTAVPTTTVA